MMRASGIFGLVLAVCVCQASAADLTSGPQAGADVGPFTVEKVAGAVNDNVSPGTHLCYRCMLGKKPVVMVFARKADKNLAELVKELDKAVAKNADQKLSSFVNLIGEKPAALKQEAKDFVADNNVQNVALVVPEENQNGPSDYNINPKAEVTVIIYKGGKVEASHALGPGQLNSDQVQSILADADKMLK